MKNFTMGALVPRSQSFDFQAGNTLTFIRLCKIYNYSESPQHRHIINACLGQVITIFQFRAFVFGDWKLGHYFGSLDQFKVLTWSVSK